MGGGILQYNGSGTGGRMNPIPPARAQPLLATKLFVPTVREEVIGRGRLLARLEAGSRRPLTVISGPAGFGKTTLLAEWAAHASMPVGWVSLDAGDNDPARFFLYLIAALDRAQPGTGGEALAALQAPEPPPVPTALTLLLNALERTPRDRALVLDDYHVIVERAVHELLALWLDHMPPQFHLLLATRADPPLPLARLRARGQLAEIREGDLRFTTPEAVAFLNERMHLNLNPAEAAALVARTEGWAAGLHLAALSLEGQPEPGKQIEAFTGSHHYVLDYLTDEVLARQPERVQRFLLQTCVLDRLCGPLCVAVTGEAESAALLADLHRANLFLAPLDETRTWYRYHPLFRDLLLARLNQADPDRVPDLHRRAAAWHDQAGSPAEAIEHAFAAQDPLLAADLIERHGHARWSLSDTAFLGLINRLPRDLVLARPTLALYHAWMLVIQGRLPEAQALLAPIRAHLPADDSHPDARAMRSFVDLLQAYIPEWTGRGAPETLPDPHALAFIPEERLAMRNTAEVMYALMLYMRGEFDAAAKWLWPSVERDRAANGTTAIPIAVGMLCRMHLIQGQLDRAAALCREYLDHMEARGKWRFYIAGNLHVLLGELLRERGDLAAAEAQIREGLRANEPWRATEAMPYSLTMLARLQLSQGDREGAIETGRRLEQAAAGRMISPHFRNELEAMRVRLWLAEGRPEAAQAWAEGHSPEGPLDFRQERDQITRARVWLALGRYAEAQALLAQLKGGARAGGRAGRQIEIALLSALAGHALREEGAALDDLDAAFNLAAPQGYVRIFLDEGARMGDLLAAYTRRPTAAHRDYARKLLQAMNRAAPGAVALVEPLTPREVEVLRLICRGDSNRDIASKLVITVSAVKKHTGNILGKLGVTRRAQAIVRARELGLFSGDD